jgi:hypothetical protein
MGKRRRGRWPFLPREAEAFASFSVFVLRTKAFAPSPRHFDQAREARAGARRNPLLGLAALRRGFLDFASLRSESETGPSRSEIGLSQ